MLLPGLQSLELNSALDIGEGMADAIAIRLKESASESQSKNKLGHTEMRRELVAQVRVFDDRRRDAQPLRALNIGSASSLALRYVAEPQPQKLRRWPWPRTAH